MKYWIVFSNDVERGGTDYVTIYGMFDSKKKAVHKILRIIKKQINSRPEDDPSYLRDVISEDSDTLGELDSDATLSDVIKALRKELYRVDKCVFSLDEYSFQTIEY